MVAPGSYLDLMFRLFDLCLPVRPRSQVSDSGPFGPLVCMDIISGGLIWCAVTPVVSCSDGDIEGHTGPGV